MAPIKVGIVGYGFSTKCFHLPYILPNPDLQVYAFLQRAEAPPKGSGAEAQDAHGKMTIRGGHCTVEFPDAKHYRTANEFFGDQAIELVVICTPNHEEFVKGALDSGKHGQSANQSALHLSRTIINPLQQILAEPENY